MRGVLPAWLITLPILLSTLSDARAGVVLRTAAQAGSEPKFIFHPSHTESAPAITGYCIDLFRAIEQADPAIHIVGDQSLMTPSRMKHLMDMRDLDLACAWLHAGPHGDGYAYVEPALFNFRFVVAVRAGDDAQVQNWDDLHKLAMNDVLLINHDWSQSASIQPLRGSRIDGSGYSTQSNLSKLVAGHGRFFLFREPGLSLEIAAAGLQDKIRILPVPLGSEPSFLVLRRNLPEADRIELANAVTRLEASGELARLRSRWNLEDAAPLQARK